MGNIIEDRVLDSISGTTPCADETCTTYDVRRERKYNALRQVTEAYLHAADTASPPDGTMSYTYTNGQLSAVADYSSVTTSYTFDDQGRIATHEGDDGGLNAVTSYSYDLWGRTATVTAPAGVTTFYEYDDFGQLAVERTRTRGDMKYEYDAAGRKTKRQRSSFKSASNAESTCWTYDWLGRNTTLDYGCNSTDWTLYYDGDSTPSGACTAGTVQTGRLSKIVAGFTRVLCYHPGGQIYAMYQRDSATWSNTVAKGFNLIFDLNGNLEKEYIDVRPSTRSYAREIEYVHDSTLKDRISYIRQKLTSSSSWSLITSDTTAPAYFAYGGIKSIEYANGITETNTRDYAARLTRRKTDYSTTVYTDINLTYDVSGNITVFDDSAGLRHMKYYAAVDNLKRLRCLARSSITSCTGSEPWEDAFLESFDYDLSGNRTNRRYGAFNSADDDAYTYVSGPTDIIDKVTSRGTDKQQTNNFRGEITNANQPNALAYVRNMDSYLTTSNDNSLGNVFHWSTMFGERYKKRSLCNQRETHYYYSPAGPGGASHELRLLDMFDSCVSEYPRHYRTFIYLEGRPIAVLHSQIASSSNNAQLGNETYWVHVDHLGTPVLVTQSDRTDRWHWENDPFGRADPIEYTLASQDVNPDDTPAYGTCGSGTQCSIWSKTYSVTGAQNIRVHFSAFSVAPGSNRTAKDYVRLYKTDGTTVIDDLTGNLGAHWSPWSGAGESAMTVDFIADNSVDLGYSGFTIDKLEYASAANGRYVMHLRMPGQIWDDDAKASYNYQRWYRREDGRYIGPDPIGRAGREPGYFGYVGANPIRYKDPTGLLRRQEHSQGGGDSDLSTLPETTTANQQEEASSQSAVQANAVQNWIKLLAGATATYGRRCTYTTFDISINLSTRVGVATPSNPDGGFYCKKSEFRIFQEARIPNGVSCQTAARMFVEGTCFLDYTGDSAVCHTCLDQAIDLQSCLRLSPCWDDFAFSFGASCGSCPDAFSF